MYVKIKKHRKGDWLRRYTQAHTHKTHVLIQESVMSQKPKESSVSKMRELRYRSKDPTAKNRSYKK